VDPPWVEPPAAVEPAPAAEDAPPAVVPAAEPPPLLDDELQPKAKLNANTTKPRERFMTGTS
jgi:hypothetical protein